MKTLVFLCLFCDVLFLPLMYIVHGHRINVVFIHQGQEVDRWWFYEPLEPLNASDPNTRYRRKTDIKAIHLGSKAKCVKNAKRAEQVNIAKVVPRYSNVFLPCRLCGASDSEAMEAKTWFRWTKELEKGGDAVVWKPEEVKMDMHDKEKFNRVFTKVDHTLVIRDFRPSDVGTYFCEAFSKKAAHNAFSFRSPGAAGGEESAVSFTLVYNKMVGKHDVDFLYHVDVETPKEATEAFKVAKNITGFKKPRKDIKIKHKNYLLYTEWTEWTECSQCGGHRKGERTRDGNCMVKILNKSYSVVPESVGKVLELYPKGAPCHSSLFQNHIEIGNVPRETEYEKCKAKCKKKAGDEFDIFKNTTVNDSAVAKDFKRKIHFDIKVGDSGSMLADKLKDKLKGLRGPTAKSIKEGSITKIICVTKRDKTAKWYLNGTQLLNTELSENNFHLMITKKGNLKITEVELTDKGHYNCSFNKGKKFKTWNVTVTPVIKVNWVKHYRLLLGSKVLCCVVFAVSLAGRSTYLMATKAKKFDHEGKKIKGTKHLAFKHKAKAEETGGEALNGEGATVEEVS